MTERLTAADASNIAMDTPYQVNVFLMAGVLAPGGPVGPDGGVDLRELRSALADRVVVAPRLAQRVRRVRRALVWQPVSLDLAQHVRRVAPVDGQGGFEALCARLIVTPLPLDRPLWELLVVPGVAPARTGVVFRVHHAMADGVAAVRLAQALMDPAVPTTGAREPSSARQAAAAPGLTGRRRVLRARLRTVASGVERTAAVLRPAVPRTALLGRIGPRRAVAFVDVELDALAVGADLAGATVNDALLAAVAAAVRAALLACGEEPPASLPASVPVALRERGPSGNAVGVMLVPLPLGEADVVRRLRRVAELTRAGKEEARSRGTFELTRTRLGTWLFMRLARHQRLVALFVTNVPGPRHPLALAGARLERIWPVTPLAGNVRLGVAAISYDGVLRCAVHCDGDAVPAAVIARTLQDELARIASLA
ncbi:WS/DGAT domain-containing protein [Antribacter sp. KLBMP9083]|uniref:diacylglycerol O-acyltransferase n=1 Tax=Antribacter soli TaxID=2910976 RepID=A0AA41QDJ3_9MICO|nr:wax ester/triacylglycerol synthase domain-containing protein [Antribacter soli]MCF4121480.1 WS/DGAT domain-containing protein [Antribacter soli]